MSLIIVRASRYDAGHCLPPLRKRLVLLSAFSIHRPENKQSGYRKQQLCLQCSQRSLGNRFIDLALSIKEGNAEFKGILALSMR